MDLIVGMYINKTHKKRENARTEGIMYVLSMVVGASSHPLPYHFQ